MTSHWKCTFIRNCYHNSCGLARCQAKNRTRELCVAGKVVKFDENVRNVSCFAKPFEPSLLSAKIMWLFPFPQTIAQILFTFSRKYLDILSFSRKPANINVQILPQECPVLLTYWWEFHLLWLNLKEKPTSYFRERFRKYFSENENISVGPSWTFLLYNIH